MSGTPLTRFISWECVTKGLIKMSSLRLAPPEGFRIFSRTIGGFVADWLRGRQTKTIILKLIEEILTKFIED